MLRRYSRTNDTKRNVNITDYIVFEDIFKCAEIHRQEDILYAVEIRGSPEIIEFRFLNDSDPFFFLLLFKMGIRFWEKHISIKVPALTFKTNSGLHVNTSLENEKKFTPFYSVCHSSKTTWAETYDEIKYSQSFFCNERRYHFIHHSKWDICINLHAHRKMLLFAFNGIVKFAMNYSPKPVIIITIRRLGLFVPFDFE